MNINHSVKLNDGMEIPVLGLGTYKSTGAEVVKAVLYALEIGYRHFDTASFYTNETEIGKALKESGINREEVFLTSKIWNSDQGYKTTKRALEASLNKLQTEYLDLYLIHWPQSKSTETWQAMVELKEQGKIRSIGVSNFHKKHIDTLLQNTQTIPSINQIELHPGLKQKELRNYCKDKGIIIEAWSPIMRGRALTLQHIQGLALKYNKTPAQIILRWQIQQNMVTIPKTVTRERLKENFNIFGFTIEEDDIEIIEQSVESGRVGPHPDSLYE
jgi:diketogulonate reductase-like aldo/keto reductase